MEKECPKCGSPMVQRMARRGKNPGKPFWGCSDYPQCKGTLDITDEDEVTVEAPVRSVVENVDSVHLKAREMVSGYDAVFFQSAAFPTDVLEIIRLNDIDMANFAKWRLDFSRAKNTVLTPTELEIISILEKILLRGRCTLLTPDLERKLLKEFECLLDIHELEQAQIVNVSTKNYEEYWFDSEEERIFYLEILPDIISIKQMHLAIPQVFISSLLAKDTCQFISQRVDFVISFPYNSLKIVVEIDGAQHSGQHYSDQARDKALEAAGYSVVRIPASEIRGKKGKNLSQLKELVEGAQEGVDWYYDEDVIIGLNAFRFCHQIQIALLYALKNGHISLTSKRPWQILSDLNEINLFSDDQAMKILRNAVNDFVASIQRLFNIFKIPEKLPVPKFYLVNSDNDPNPDSIFISFNNTSTTTEYSYYVRNIMFPGQIAFPEFKAKPLSKYYDPPKKEDLEYFLDYIFRKLEFREGQYRAIIKILQGEDCLILLPTGAGKSIVYQLAAFLMPGITFIVDPIIALMNDQVHNLTNAGVDRCIAISSEMDSPEIKEKALKLLARGEYLFAFVSPERFQSDAFRQSTSALAQRVTIPLVVIDEAHCVSEWGHDFRPAYLCLSENARRYCTSGGLKPVLVGLTGTASISVLNDVKRELDIHLTITPESFDRKELNFDYKNIPSLEKPESLRRLLEYGIPLFFDNPPGTYECEDSGLIFCPHVNGKYGVVNVKAKMDKWLDPDLSKIYSGEAPMRWNKTTYSHYKKETAKEFKNNLFPILVCTKSYGMGIDKSNIHFTIHYNIPPSIEAFYQEAGRAGRDRKDSLCQILYSNEFDSRNNKLLNPTTDIEYIQRAIDERDRSDDDDISRMLFFHCKGFMGIEHELNYVENIVNEISESRQSTTRQIYLSRVINDNQQTLEDKKNNTEKAIIRLVRLGVISDYTYDYSKNCFSISISGISKQGIIDSFEKYIATYLVTRGKTEANKLKRFEHVNYNDFIIKSAEQLLNFVYEVIERSRRAALAEMLRALETSRNTDEFRERILHYLQPTPYARDIEDIIYAENWELALSFANRIFETILSKINAKEIRGQVERYLESYPDHPLLRILHALIESVVENPNEQLIQEEFMSGILFGNEKYGFDESTLISIIINVLPKISLAHRETTDIIIDKLLSYWEKQNMDYLNLSRELVKSLPPENLSVPAWTILDDLNKKTNSVITSMV